LRRVTTANLSKVLFDVVSIVSTLRLPDQPSASELVAGLVRRFVLEERKALDGW